MLRPEPLRVAGEALVEPDVLPGFEPDAVTEPLVGQFVRYQSLDQADAAGVVGAEDGHGLRLERNLEHIGRDDNRVRGEGIRAKRFLEELHHRGKLREIGEYTLTQPRRIHERAWHAPERDGGSHIAADLECDEVACGRLCLLEHPVPAPGRDAVLHLHSRSDDGIALLCRHPDAVTRLIGDVIVAGEPARRSRGL